MQNLRIATRLSLGFGAMLLLLMLITVVGGSGGAGQSRMTQRIADHLYPKAILALQVQLLQTDDASLARNAVLATDKAIKADSKRQYDRNEALLREKLAALESMVDADDERRLLDAAKSAQAAYSSLLDEVVVAGLEGKTDEAGALLFGSRIRTQTEAGAALRALSDYQQQEARNGSAQSRFAFVSTRRIVVGISALALLVGAALAWFVSRSITAPLREAVVLAERVASGDLSIAVSSHSRDETGQLLMTLERMRQNVSSIVGSVRDNAQSVSSASSQIASGNADLSARTEQQAASLEETASSMVELTETVRQNADNARRASTLAINATDVANVGAEGAQNLAAAIDEMNSSSSRISEITDVIEGIAFQTNILALNAAVESARAGEQGRGFAVVADEVRALAQRSASAAKEIKELIGASVASTRQSAHQASIVSTQIGQVRHAIKQVSDIVGEISVASEEQSRGIEQINQAVVKMDGVTQHNAALVEEAAAAAKSLEEHAQMLERGVSVFKIRLANH